MGKIKPLEDEQKRAAERRVEIITCVVLFAFGVYHSILYFGHTAVPNSDFPSLYRIGNDLLSFRMPSKFKQAPVLGLLQNFLYPLTWGPFRPLTAGWLLNAILHPFNLIGLWLVGKKIVGKAAVWIAIIAIINPWTIYSLTEPINETTYLFFILLSFYLIFRRSRWAYLAAGAATMVRYEATTLILAAFVADIIHRNNRRDVIKAFAFSALAFVPFLIWMTMTVLTFKTDSSHYLKVLFSKEYAKGFTEPVQNRTGIVLHLKLLWQVAFQPLFMPYAGAGEDTIEMLFKLSKTAGVAGFALGCVFAFRKKLWEILILMLFFVPYFILHAYYPYPLQRFHSTVFWIALLVAWFGLQSTGQLIAQKAKMPKPTAIILQILVIITAGAWTMALIPYFGKAAAVSPTSASMPYAAMAVTGLICVLRLYAGNIKTLPKVLAILAVMSVMISSNQFALARLLGDGQREIEFKQLGEWFAANGGPDDKMAVYNNITQVFAGKNEKNVIGFPKAENPAELANKLRELGVTYVVWATREGYSRGQHTGYQQLGLNKNIVFLDKPRDIGCYKFIGQAGTKRGYVNIFRLMEQGEEQLPGP